MGEKAIISIVWIRKTGYIQSFLSKKIRQKCLKAWMRPNVSCPSLETPQQHCILTRNYVRLSTPRITFRAIAIGQWIKTNAWIFSPGLRVANEGVLWCREFWAARYPELSAVRAPTHHGNGFLHKLPVRWNETEHANVLSWHCRTGWWTYWVSLYTP